MIQPEVKKKVDQAIKILHLLSEDYRHPEIFDFYKGIATDPRFQQYSAGTYMDELNAQKYHVEYYGMELIIDLTECNIKKFNRYQLKKYFVELCKLIDMKRSKLVFWDDLHTAEGEQQEQPHTKGTSAVQFILTSNITIHTLDILESVYINIFSCKGYDWYKAMGFSAKFFEGSIKNHEVILRRK